MKKTIYTITALILLIPLVYAGTIEDYVNNLDTSYYDGTINITTFEDSMIDIDSNNLNDTLFFNLTTNFWTEDTFIANLFFENERIPVLTDTRAISSNNPSFYMNISSYYLSESKNIYFVRIYNQIGQMVLESKKYNTSTYTNFESGTNVTSVSDQNVANNYIRFNLNLDVMRNETVNISVNLQKNDTIISATKETELTTPSQAVTINFDNETIKSTHYVGTYNVTNIIIGDKIIEYEHTTSGYNYETFAKTSYIKSYEDGLIDTNDNNLSEFLEINFTLEIKDANTYNLEAEIRDTEGNYITLINETESLSTGQQTIQARINGSEIYSTYLNGPYVISYAKLSSNGDQVDIVYEPYKTDDIYYSEFEPPELPDLDVSLSFQFNPNTNETSVSVNLTNIGQKPALNIFLDVFDNSTYANETTLNYLNSSSMATYSYLIHNSSNHTIITAIADFGNIVDESNETNNIAQYVPSDESSCLEDSDCETCYKCINETCFVQSDSEDLKNECNTECSGYGITNGLCDGAGSCSSSTTECTNYLGCYNSSSCETSCISQSNCRNSNYYCNAAGNSCNSDIADCITPSDYYSGTINEACAGGYARQDWDSTYYCTDDSTGCVTDNLGSCNERSNNYEACDGDNERICNSGTWSSQNACPDQTCSGADNADSYLSDSTCSESSGCSAQVSTECISCQTCSGTSCVSYSDNNQDTLGSNTCSGICDACQAGSCSNADSGTDPGDDCSETCSDYTYNDGNCDGSGNCNSGSACPDFFSCLNGTSCYSSCTSQTDCRSSDYYCDAAGNACVSDANLGGNCVGVAYSGTNDEVCDKTASAICDDDGIGDSDDNWCFTPYNTYFDGQETTYCEYSASAQSSYTDEKTVGTMLNRCDGLSYYEEKVASDCTTEDHTSVFECTETGCSCTESLCDGLTTGDNITTCSSGETYFADECTSTAGGQDRDNICRSSGFAAGCTADSECNGIEAGTGNCNSTCNYNLSTSDLEILDYSVIYSNGFNRVFEFVIKNNGGDNLSNIDWNIDFDDGNNINDSSLGLEPGENSTIIVDYTFSGYGMYDVSVNVNHGENEDSDSTLVNLTYPYLHLVLYDFEVISSSGLNKVFEFRIKNYENSTLNNVNWNLDLGDGNDISDTGLSLDQNENMTVIVDYTYASSSTYNVNASVESGSLTDYENMTIFAG